MVGYQPYRAPVPVRSRELGQTGAGVAVGASSLLATALGVGTTWIGLRSAKRERGGYRVMGYTVAVFGSIVVLSSLAGAAGFFGGLFGAKTSA